jgi:hypothetical protein
MRYLLALFALCAMIASAADVTGKWKYEITTQDGQKREGTFNLKSEGGKITGTIESQMGSSPIQEGTVSGDNVSFSAVRNFGGNEMKFNYKGTVSGSEMKLKVQAGERDFEMTAKKI